jgi:hypothetical protein
MKLLTVATHSERYYPYLKLSAEKYGHELVTLGWGEKWKGFTWRFELIRNYLKSLDDQLICFIDGYDVLILNDAATIENKFNEITNNDKTKVVVSVEIPTKSLIDNLFLIQITKCNNYSINAGTYIGYSSALLILYEKLCNKYKCTNDSVDQIFMQKHCLEGNNELILDTQSKLFLVITSISEKLSSGKHDIEIKDDVLFYKNQTPCILHASAYTDFDDIIDSLGYDNTIFRARNENKNAYIISFIKNWSKHLYIEYYLPINIFIFLLIFSLIYTFNLMNIKLYINKQIKSLLKIKINKK